MHIRLYNKNWYQPFLSISLCLRTKSFKFLYVLFFLLFLDDMVAASLTLPWLFISFSVTTRQVILALPASFFLSASLLQDLNAFITRTSAGKCKWSLIHGSLHRSFWVRVPGRTKLDFFAFSVICTPYKLLELKNKFFVTLNTKPK